ncbi:MAG: hypothetical protein AAEJ52_23160 [Myxococcota bacterium]|jgi:2-keto-4-pentenoate hydratase
MMTQSKDIARAMVDSRAAGRDWPLPSQAIEGLDVDIAYEIQRELVAQRLSSDEVAGFKAGATSAPAQRMLGLEAPFTGVLFANGRRENGVSIAATDFRGLVLETELCFRIGSAIARRVPDVKALREHIDACRPAIELADAGGYGAAKFTGLDLIAGNGASAAVLLGAEADWQSPAIDELAVSFSRDGELLHEAMSGDLMGGQWQALLWLVNAVIDQGYELEPGHLLLTGSLGSGHPGLPGRYVADYGAFGRIAFDVA